MLLNDAHDLAVFLNKVQPLVDKGDLPRLLEVMRVVVRGNILIETRMCDTLSTLALSDKDSSETVVRTGGIALVVDCMKFYVKLRSTRLQPILAARQCTPVPVAYFSVSPVP
jgi:hypothetical protein